MTSFPLDSCHSSGTALTVKKDAVQKHKKNFKDANINGIDDDEEVENDKSLGTAAAMQALKMFSSGQAGGKQSQGTFITLAMTEAVKVGGYFIPF